MQGTIAVEILGHRIRPVLALQQAASGVLRLTTSDDLQRSGKVRILLLRGQERILLRELVVREIPGAPAGEPDIDLAARYDGETGLRVEILVNGRSGGVAQLDLSPYRKKRWAIAAVAAAAVVVVAALVVAAATLRPFSEHPGPGQPRAASGTGGAGARQGAAEPGEAATDLGGAGAPAGRTSSQPAQGQGGRPGGEEARGQGSAPGRPAAAEEAGGAAAAAQVPREAEGAGETAGAGETETPPGQPAGGAPVQETAAAKAETPAVSQPQQHSAAIYFPPDSASLTQEGRLALEQLAGELRGAAGVVRVEGHCALYGSEEGRTQLSLERARAVEDYLRRQGWQPARIEVRGLGGRSPVTRDPQRQELNRRVEVMWQTND